jgi:ATP synthase protein I
MDALLQYRMRCTRQGVQSASGRLPQRTRRCACAAAANDAEEPQQPQKQRSKLPDRGFFAEANTKAEVYSPLGGVDRGDIYKRGGRYSPEFVWNINWQEQLELEEAVERQRLEAEARGPQQETGHLSFRRVLDLNSMEVDLSEQLRPRAQPAADVQAASADGAAPAAWKGRQRQGGYEAGVAAATAAQAAQRGPSAGSFPRMPPRRGEAQRWERSSKFAKRGSTAPSTPEDIAVLAATVRAERAAYARYKKQLLASTAALGSALAAATFTFYSKDVGVSFSIGAVFSVVYLNLLNRSIDAVGADSSIVPDDGATAAGGALQAPRLLIPIIMAMTYNRWNTLAAADTHISLQLMPMLLGFLTYKGAVIARGGLDLFADLSGGGEAASQAAAAAAVGSAGLTDAQEQQRAAGKADELIIGRDYANRILQG